MFIFQYFYNKVYIKNSYLMKIINININHLNKIILHFIHL